MKYKIFILESNQGPTIIKEDLRARTSDDLEFNSSPGEYKRHLPKKFDLYILHMSMTEEEAVKELRKEQPWSKIFIRNSITLGDLPSSLRTLIDGYYDIKQLVDAHSTKLLRNIGAKVCSDKEWAERRGKMLMGDAL